MWKLEIPIALAVVCLCTGAPSPSSKHSADPNAIVEQSTKVTEADQQASTDYDCSETDLQPDGSHKTFKVQMIDGSPYEELTAVNGKPLSKDKQAKEQRKLQEEIAKREHESKQEREHRIAKFHKELDRDHHFIDEIGKAFTFKMVGEQQLNHRPVYVIDASPRSGFHPPDRESAVLAGMKGRLWIDKNTYHWVRVEAQVIHTVSIEGFLAKVEPGTRFELEKIPVEANIWLPKHFAMISKAKVLSFIKHNEQQDETYFNYHKAQHGTQAGQVDEKSTGKASSTD